jgi:hypothetical protein
MVGLHDVNGVLVIAACLVSAGWAGFCAWRKRPPGRLLVHLLSLTQVLVIAQAALGLLLLSDGRRASDRLHYLYGALALGAVLSPWLYAPPVPSRRLVWFGGAALVAGALAIRAYVTAG